MSGPRIKPPRHQALSRRDFLRRAALGTMAFGSLPLLPACGGDGEGGRGNGGGSDADLEFRHGIASGDPLADRVML